MRHKERLSALGQFAAGIAHELRNPLATIRLRTQMSQRADALDVVARNSNVILEEIDRLDTIIGRLLYFARSAATILCDRGRMLQVLDNLLDNAVHAASGQMDGRVRLITSKDGAFAQIEVRDNGQGFDPETLSHAMDPFFTTKETGTGLGLSISFEIVQAHNGEMHLSNDPNGGAIACVHLPLAPLEPKLVPIVQDGVKQSNG